jgi:hypothetical protein
LDIAVEDLRFVGINRTNKSIPPRNWMHSVFDWNYIVCKEVDPTKQKLQTEEVAGLVWVPLDEFESDLHDAERTKKYSPHQLYLYDMAIYEIRQALAEAAEKETKQKEVA